MAAYTAAYTDIRSNDATRFRTQMGWIATQLENIGWAKQGDTGQIDFSSVAAPTAADQSMGYEIRKSSAGLYLKIEYGAGYAAYSKSLWLTFASATDGAGGIAFGKELSQRRQIRTALGYTGGAARAGDDYVSGDANRIMVTMQDDTNPLYGAAFALSRNTDENGDYDDTGWTVVRGQHNAYGDQFSIGTSDAFAVGTMGLVRLPRVIGSAPSDITFIPVYAYHPIMGMFRFPDAYVAAYSLVGAQATFTIDGKTYLSGYGNTNAASVWGAQSAANMALLLRYD